MKKEVILIPMPDVLMISNQLIQLLNHPSVVTLLLVIGLIGITVELLHPGLGAPGVIGFFSFALYFYGQLEAGYGSWLSPTLFILAVFLLVIEMVISGAGIFGISGVILLFYSVVSAAPNLAVGMISLSIGIFITILVLWILVKFFGMKLMWNRFVLISEQKNEEGYRSSENRKELLGQIGLTVTPLRPSGIAQFGDRREDVVSEGELIPINVEVIVIEVEGTRVVVRRVENEDKKLVKSGE